MPAGALTAPVAITLTPASSLAGLPLEGGLVAAVELQPAGLQFALPATLYVAPAGGVPTAPVAAFGWAGNANAFGVSPWWTDPKGRWAALLVDHFSGYGLGIPGASQLDAVAAELLGFEADLAAFLAATPCIASPTASCTPAEFEALLTAYYDQLVAPRLAAGGVATALSAALGAHQALDRWISAIVALGVSSAGLDVRRSGGLSANHANLLARRAEYTVDDCSGAVADWKDWLRVPEEIRLRVAPLYAGSGLAAFELSKHDYCVTFVIDEVAFPSEVEAADTELPLSFRTLVVAPGGEEIPVVSDVDLVYGDGASGPAELTTDADGFAELTVERTVGGPLSVVVDLEAVETSLERPDVLKGVDQARAGSLGLYFPENLTTGPRPILDSGEAVEVCVFATVGAPAGQTVQFALEGPGEISATAVATTAVGDPGAEIGEACTTYTAPAGPVGKELEAELRAELDSGGETYADALRLYPFWADLTLEADVGAGFQQATNQNLFIGSDGPFLTEARLLVAGADTEEPPSQPHGEALQVLADEPTLLVADCCETQLVLVSDNLQPSTFAFFADGSPSPEHPVDVLYGPLGGPAVAATVVFDRLPPDLSLLVSPLVNEGTPVSVEVTATLAGDPAPGYFVEFAATGGSVGIASGTTGADGRVQTTASLDPGSALLEIHAAVREAPDAEVLKVLVAQVGTGAAGVIEQRYEFVGFMPTGNPTPPPATISGTHLGGVDLTLPEILDSLGNPLGLAGSLHSDVVLAGDGSLQRVEATLSVEHSSHNYGPRAAFLLGFRVGQPTLVEFALDANVTGGFGTFLNEAEAAFAFDLRDDFSIGCIRVNTNGPVPNGCINSAPSGQAQLGPGQTFWVRAVVQAQAHPGSASATLELDFSPIVP